MEGKSDSIQGLRHSERNQNLDGKETKGKGKERERKEKGLLQWRVRQLSLSLSLSENPLKPSLLVLSVRMWRVELNNGTTFPSTTHNY